MVRAAIANRREQNEKNTLAYVKEHWKTYGYGPSYRDIERNLGISAGSAKLSVKTLSERGLISVEPGTARSIRPIKGKK